jgi:hypothetical protein
MGIGAILVYAGAIIGGSVGVWAAPESPVLGILIFCVFLSPAVLYSEYCREGKLKAKSFRFYAMLLLVLTLSQLGRDLGDELLPGSLDETFSPDAIFFGFFLAAVAYSLAQVIVEVVSRLASAMGARRGRTRDMSDWED